MLGAILNLFSLLNTVFLVIKFFLKLNQCFTTELLILFYFKTVAITKMVLPYFVLASFLKSKIQYISFQHTYYVACAKISHHMLILLL